MVSIPLLTDGTRTNWAMLAAFLTCHHVSVDIQNQRVGVHDQLSLKGANQ